jgi:hypothetical protein
VKNLDLNKLGIQVLNAREMNEKNWGGLMRFAYRVSHAYLTFKTIGVEYDQIKTGKCRNTLYRTALACN